MTLPYIPLEYYLVLFGLIIIGLGLFSWYCWLHATLAKEAETALLGLCEQLKQENWSKSNQIDYLLKMSQGLRNRINDLHRANKKANK